MRQQNDLLDIDAIWFTDPTKGFDSFVQSIEFVELGKHGRARKAEGRAVYPIAKSSQEVYCHMFGNFSKWMKTKHLRINEIGETEIREFLDIRHDGKDTEGKKLNSMIRVRYLRLLERVFTHLGVSPNPATKAAYGVHKSAEAGRDKAKVYLTEKEQAAFLANLPAIEPFDPKHPFAPSWKRRRDRAMLAMMLGAGLKVSEVMALNIKNVQRKDSAGCIPIKIVNPALRTDDNSHKTILRPFAVPYVLPWIEERKRLKQIPSDRLFPASLKEGEMLNKATVYRQVKATLQKAGIDLDHMGGRTLRNSFAVIELKNGTDIETVGMFLGLVERRSTEKYVVQEQQKELKQ